LEEFVPELASRAHQENLIPVVQEAIFSFRNLARSAQCDRLYQRSRINGIPLLVGLVLPKHWLMQEGSFN